MACLMRQGSGLIVALAGIEPASIWFAPFPVASAYPVGQ